MVTLLIGVYAFFSALAILLDMIRRTSRWALQLLLWLNFAGAVVLLVLFERLGTPRILGPQNQGHAELLVIIVLAGLFSLSVEVPGFWLNTRHDLALVAAADEIASKLLELRLDPTIDVEQVEGSLDRHSAQLSELGLSNPVGHVAAAYRRMGNIDNGLLDRTLSEVREVRARVDDRSKHPAPILVEILSLSGLGFVLCEILSVLRGH